MQGVHSLICARLFMRAKSLQDIQLKLAIKYTTARRSVDLGLRLMTVIYEPINQSPEYIDIHQIEYINIGTVLKACWKYITSQVGNYCFVVASLANGKIDHLKRVKLAGKPKEIVPETDLSKFENSNLFNQLKQFPPYIISSQETGDPMLWTHN